MMHDRILLAESRDYIVELSYFELDRDDKTSAPTLIPFIHLSVRYFSSRVLRELLCVWECVRPNLPPIVFAQGTTDDNKLAKLVSKFGFIFHADCLCDDGLNRRLFVSYRN